MTDVVDGDEGGGVGAGGGDAPGVLVGSGVEPVTDGAVRGASASVVHDGGHRTRVGGDVGGEEDVGVGEVVRRSLASKWRTGAMTPSPRMAPVATTRSSPARRPG